MTNWPGVRRRTRARESIRTLAAKIGCVNADRGGREDWVIALLAASSGFWPEQIRAHCRRCDPLFRKPMIKAAIGPGRRRSRNPEKLSINEGLTAKRYF